ncbi:MAG: division/cell wall cluster transcriptional repressor MraZ [Lachnospiraceae bacterium]|nr:division/cell wall cluster transcriptional repressor MraZ [Lachnospiraceae bacterium]
MFIGEYNHTIDAKGRIIVPSKFRDQLGESFVISKGLDGCLYIYPGAEWESFLEKLKTLPSSKDSRKIVRFFTAGADEAEIDKQGRVLIKNELREHAKLEKDVVLAGTLNRIEIWSKAMYDSENDDDIDDIAEKMADYGLSI